MLSLRAASRKQEALCSAARQYVTALRVEFSEGVAAPKKKEATALLDEWKGKKDATEGILKLLQAYKDLGDSKSEPLLKFHNPRTFEDLAAPVPNFRAQSLKPGEVGKFFDVVLQKRAGEAVDAKDKWWVQRKSEAEGAATSQPAASLGTLPVPAWELGKPVSLDSLNKVTDAYLGSLEPARKVSIPAIPASVKESITSFMHSAGQDKSAGELIEVITKAVADKAVVVEKGKALPDFEFVSKAVAAKVLAARRAEVHARYVKMWAKKVLVSPELAAVPLKEVDSQLASKFELLAPQYADLLQAASAGSKTLAERMSHHPALSSFLLKREKEAIKADFPVSETEAAGVALAKELEADPSLALERLLGPELEGALAGKPLSVVVAAVTAHKYSTDRYMYREGMKLAQKYKAEEEALAAELKPLYGESVDVAAFQAAPRTPAQQIVDRLKELEARASEFKAELEAADNAYLKYAAAKKQQVVTDPTNIAFDEVLYPGLVEEQLEIELAELKEEESKIDDAEEEELWMLTLSAQFRHIQKHFGVDLPHSVLAYMDPVLIKKIDWETTNGLEDWDITLDDMGAEVAKEQWGVENLSHHFLPLIRYRREKARKASGRFEPELVAGRTA